MGRFLKRVGWLILFILFCLLAVAALNIRGFAFSGYLFFGCAGLILVYRILHWLKKRKPKLSKILRTLLTIALCAGLLLAAVTGIFVGVAQKGDTETKCRYVIVLGAGVNGTEPSLILSERIHKAYEYLTQNPEVICIVSGGQGPGEEITEAQCMFDRLTAMGIDPQRIWLEDKSTSTRENLRFSMELIEEKTGSRPTQAAVISNEFHLFRASLFAKEQGLDMVGVPAKTTWITLHANYFLREIVAIWYYVILGG